MNVAVMTGASSGIGRAIAAKLSEACWRVVRLSRQAAPAVADEYAADLSDLAAVAQLGGRLVRELPRVDAFIHVAGVWHTDDEVLAGKSLDSFTSKQIGATMNVGVTSAMLLCGALLPVMQHGTVIGISGTFNDGAQGWLPYYASKRALEDFLVGLSQDRPDVRVFGVSPADTATPAYATFYPQYLSEAQKPEAVADVILSLLHEDTPYRTGDIIEVRNGEMQRGFHV